MKTNKPRNQQPDLVRKAGPHVKPSVYEPDACYACGGTGTVQGYREGEIYSCVNCNGTGEI